MNINSKDFKSINDDWASFGSISKLSVFALYISGNLVLFPSWRSFIESIKSNCPKFQDEYWSLNTSVTVNSKSLINFDVFKNLSVTNPTGLNTSPILKL